MASRKAGREVTCPSCGRDVLVPALAADDSDRTRPAAEPVHGEPSGEPALAEPAAAEPAPSGVAGTGSGGGAFLGLPASDLDEDSQVRIRKAATEFEDMDLTPMVDVTFLLLIFFMITAAFSLTKTIEVPSPDPEQQGAQQTQTLEDLEKNSIMVRIDSQNSILVEDEPVGDPSRLVDVLTDRRRTDDKHELILQADAQALHETVVLVLDAANEVQFTRIRLAALTDSDE
ncbi:MAG TPA: biopolymer transporter ExbD [Planctomycetaceae bacterium]|nr:biopolymer transporter ExbD [Planctomycetaceae bacterium]